MEHEDKAKSLAMLLWFGWVGLVILGFVLVGALIGQALISLIGVSGTIGLFVVLYLLKSK